jgi:sporulation protein YlmC with PRC-barrel domain
LNAKELCGKEIIGVQGWKIGKVRDVVLDMSTWQVKAFEVELAKNVAEEFGMKKILRKTSIPIKIDDIQGVGDTVTLKISKAQLQKLLEPRPIEKMTN